MRIHTRGTATILAGGILLLSGSPVRSAEAQADGPMAVIVNAENQCADPTFEELRSILTLERQFWKDGRRIVLILPPSGSSEKQVLLDRVYHMTDAQLRSGWARRLFSGEIAAVPTSLRTTEALVGAVRRSPGAIAVVPASAVPPGVRVLAVGGKRPGQSGYPLSSTAFARNSTVTSGGRVLTVDEPVPDGFGCLSSALGC